MTSHQPPKTVRSNSSSSDATHTVNPGAQASTGPAKLKLVLKLGTSSICDEVNHFPKLSNLSLLVETIVKLRQLGHEVAIVSSGAVGVGLRRLDLSRKPKHLAQVQAVAAVGQGRLMALYDELFGQFDIPIAQILLTKDNLAERSQYLNACNTFRELWNMNVVPIVNENDTVSNSEIRFGDNDTLSAIVAGMVNADYLFLLTDVDALYTDNPRSNPDAQAVRVVEDVAKLRAEVKVSSPGSALGTGGMVTKLIAADLATAAGCTTIITLGSTPQKILDIITEISTHKQLSAVDQNAPFNPTIGTYFLAKPNPMLDRKWWILHGLATYGSIYVDAGAAMALVRGKSSLFAAGIVKVEGNFVAQQCVRILTIVKPKSSEVTDGTGDAFAESMGGVVAEIGKGIVNYTASDVQRIAGVKSAEIVEILGYMDSEYVCHRDNIVLTTREMKEDRILLRRRSPRSSTSTLAVTKE
ncbi:hypothetical protein HK102_005663 [Quaeritorhiza haematococci]|nr:hypothetical protein HK102_005663 [Quaeritorhiza haematococci]